MRFGLMGSAQADGATTGGMGQGFKSYIDYNIEAEALGYHGAFLVEHHFSGWAQVSATLSLLTYLAARTTTLRLGTSVTVLPWHNPVLLAEQAATLDVLSGGRLDFGVGKGYRHSEFKGFCIPPEQAQERFEEALEIIIKSWSSAERFSHHGKHWNFEDIIVEPAVVQRPRPPIWMGAGSETSIRNVAQRGFGLILDQFANTQLIGQRIAMYRSELAARGQAFDPSNVCVARDVYIAKNQDDKAEALALLSKRRQRTIEVSRAPNQVGGSHILAYAQSGVPDADGALVGTPDEIYRKLVELSDVGVDYVLLCMLGGSRESLRQFAAELMPAMNSHVATAAQ